MTSLTDEKYKCPENGCGASYSKPFKLEIHKRKHTGERPFVCDTEGCSNSYTNIAHLKRHKCLVHEKTDEVLCLVNGCGKVFNNRYSLKKHSNQEHNTTSNIYNNTYKCEHCLEEFKKKRVLKRHLYTHKEEKALKCEVCNISFDTLHLFNKHKRNHKTYACDCGTVVNRWTEFCEHRKNCTVKKIDHTCIICKKVFTTKQNLKTHSLSHLEESQKNIFRCPYLNCNRSYQYKKNLTYHIAALHERKFDKEIRCTENGCNLVFKTERYLKKHILNIHKVPLKKKPRKPRKDKSKKKKCLASILSNVLLTPREHMSILNNDRNSNPEEILDNNSKRLIDVEKQSQNTSDEINNECLQDCVNMLPNECLSHGEEILKQKCVGTVQNKLNFNEILIY